MATSVLTAEIMQAALDLGAEHNWSWVAAARASGIDRGTLRHRADKARAAGLIPLQKPQKPRIRVPARSSYQPVPDAHGESVRVLVWGCAHDSPSLPDKSRFANAGKLAAHLQPDYIVDLGDTMDMDSLSTHAMPGSVDDRERPFFKAEIASLTEAIFAFNEHAPSADDIPRFHLHGNHENRAWRFEGNNPTSQGVFTTEIDQVYARMGFTIKAFREWLYIAGVGFTHCPIDGRGREMSGMNADQAIARESTHSVVWTHTHRSNRVHKAKIGIGNSIDVFNTGTFMPMGYIKSYAGLSMTGWTYGIHLVTIRDGSIESVKTWSTLELEEEFGVN